VLDVGEVFREVDMLDGAICAEQAVAWVVEDGGRGRVRGVVGEGAGVEEGCVSPVVVDCSSKPLFLSRVKQTAVVRGETPA